MSTESAAPVVVIDAGRPDGIARGVQALVQATAADVTVVLGGTSEARAVAQELFGAASRAVTVIDEAGAALWNAASGRHPGQPLVLVDGATEPVPGWLETLCAVAARHPDAASVTPLSNAAAFLSVPRRNLPWPLLAEHTPQAVAARVAAETLSMHPRVPTALPHCALLSWPALELAGLFETALPPGEALADWSARATAVGLQHLVADELVVGHRGELEGWASGQWPVQAGDRHPALRAAVAEAAESRHSPLSRALLSASVALEPLSVTVDARCLAATQVTGTVMHVVEVLGALSARDDVRVRAVLPETVAPVLGAALGRMERLDRTTVPQLDTEPSRTHVVHRPWQVDSLAELALLDLFGERTVITNQDLIAYRTPAVFYAADAWLDYRRTTRDALGLASGVVCFSDAAAEDLLAEDLAAVDRVTVVPLGAEPQYLRIDEAVRPAGLAEGQEPFLLMLGTRFRHKNVGFALELLAALRSSHGWSGRMVLAGADVLHGSGSAEDAAWMLRNSGHAEHVVDLGPITEAEKRWLMREAAAVVYPSAYEGFGLVPFEAAALGTPCLLASVSSLREHLDPELALLQPWSAAASAVRVAPVLGDAAQGSALAAAQRAAGGALTWERTADGLVDAYRTAIRAPVSSAVRLTDDLARVEHDYWQLRDQVASAAWRLIDPDRPLVDESLAERLAGVLEQDDGHARLDRAISGRRRLPFRSGR